MSGLFEKASRKRIVFLTSRGTATVDDLWDIPFTSNNDLNLQSIATSISKEIKELGEQDFVGDTQSGKSEDLNLTLDIIKHVIKVRKEEIAGKTNAMLNEQKKEKVRKILDERKDEELNETSTEDLQAMLDE